ncbi:MAG: hypothetical protein LAO19_10255 [Acidobacteriia bacterium]|nr:hypothetical protein [Terriglobia bacterium]
MIEKLEEHVTGVVCLRCGMITPLHVSGAWGSLEGAREEFHFPILIVRCHECGKEASYLADEIVPFKSMANTLHAAA